MAKKKDVYRFPDRDCKVCGGRGVVMAGTKANPQEHPCPKCNPNKNKVPFI